MGNETHPADSTNDVDLGYGPLSRAVVRGHLTPVPKPLLAFGDFVVLPRFLPLRVYQDPNRLSLGQGRGLSRAGPLQLFSLPFRFRPAAPQLRNRLAAVPKLAGAPG